MLFPVELGRAHVITAGSGGKVLDIADSLVEIPASLPWLCILDRDLMTQAEVDELESRHPNVHIWPKRAFESMLLEPDLIAATMTGVGRETELSEAEEWLAEGADALKAEVIGNMVDRRLTTQFPPPATDNALGRYERVKAHHRAYAKVNTERADAVETVLALVTAEIEAHWVEDRQKLADPKALAARVHQKAGNFKTKAALLAALVAKAKQDPMLRPVGLEQLRVRLQRMVVSK